MTITETFNKQWASLNVNNFRKPINKHSKPTHRPRKSFDSDYNFSDPELYDPHNHTGFNYHHRSLNLDTTSLNKTYSDQTHHTYKATYADNITGFNDEDYNEYEAESSTLTRTNLTEVMNTQAFPET